MQNIKENLERLRQRIESAAIQAQRDPKLITLLAASKAQAIDKIQQAIFAGQKAFGENYLQEALIKQAALKNEASLEWHYIGSIQSNKTKLIAENFDWVHSVDRVKIAQRLNDQRPSSLAPLNICIEININNEESKSGVFAPELRSLADSIMQLPRLKLRGLMVIPKESKDYQQQLSCYQGVAKIQQQLVDQGLPLDTLSMGMSDDFEAAIAAGSAIVRVGRALFGPR